MAELAFDGVSKDFDGKRVLDQVSLDIKDGEMVALLGPSGCGKTTMLRLAAGFERPENGSVRKGTITLSDGATFIPPEQRNMGIVFQSYALWPNMSVADNIAYPLRVRHMADHQVDAILADALDSVSLTDYANASPSILSGGQRQRVALARCLVMQPDAVLLDEPLANLDAHLREVMQQTFLDFHAQSGATMVYVTHDQSEAMAMADRIAVMFDGRLQQVDKPQTLYDCPATEAVAAFIGKGSVLTAYLEQGPDGTSRSIVIHGQVFRARCSIDVQRMETERPVRVCVRPEDVTLCDEDGLPARVTTCTYLGERYLIVLHMADGTPLMAYSASPARAGTIAHCRISDAWAFAAE